MKTRIVVYVATVGVLLATATADAAKIYKWVDEEGNVQYTQTPGPQQSIDDATGIGAGGSGSDSDSGSGSDNDYGGSVSLLGKWYAHERGSDYLFWIRGSTYSWDEIGKYQMSDRIHRGTWDIGAEGLKLTYKQHKLAPDLEGKSEYYRVIERSRGRLTLQAPNKELFHFVQKGGSKKSPKWATDRLVGRWGLQGTNWVLTFRKRTFSIEGSLANLINGTLYAGNWWVESNELVFEYSGQSHFREKSGQRERMTMLLNDKTTLRLKSATDGRVYDYAKISRK